MQKEGQREISIALPISELKVFGNLFFFLEANFERLRIESYGVTLTTLEEVIIFSLKKNIK